MAGIYLHIPFCKQACFYCDFHFSTSIDRRKEMVKAIAEELYLRKEENNEAIETIYFGGGTPSLLSVSEITFLLDTIKKHYTVVENPEVTLEANPDDLMTSKILELSKTKINRLSIGVQSFFEDDLKAMNRAHNALESVACIEEASKYFDNITIDLIYGIPNMSVDKWKQNLQKAFELKVNHISSYALTVEPKTALDTFIKKGKYPNVDDALASEHFQILLEKTSQNNFVQYEISNFGKQNYFSKHNTSYWQGKSYIGVGPSAHSFKKNERSWNVSNNVKYIKAISKGELPSESEILTKKDRFNEYIMTGLRTIWGVDLEKVLSDFGEEYSDYILNEITVFVNQQLLQVENKKITATSKGKFLIDGIASELFMI